MNFFMLATQYILELKDKGYYDEGFMVEYEFLCLETYKIRNPKAIQEVNNIQAKALLQRDGLR